MTLETYRYYVKKRINITLKQIEGLERCSYRGSITTQMKLGKLKQRLRCLMFTWGDVTKLCLKKD